MDAVAEIRREITNIKHGNYCVFQPNGTLKKIRGMRPNICTCGASGKKEHLYNVLQRLAYGS